MDDRGNALLKAHVHPVPEGKKGVADHGGTDQTAFFGSHFPVDGVHLFHAVQVFIRDIKHFNGIAVGQFTIGLVPGDFGHAHPVLLTGADADGGLILDINNRIGSNSRFDQPAEHHVPVFLVRGHTFDTVFFALVGTFGRQQIVFGQHPGNKGPLGDDPAVDQAFEIHATPVDKRLQLLDVSDPDDPQVLPAGQDLQCAFLIFRGHDDLRILGGHGFGRGLVDGPVDGDTTTERGDPVGHVGPGIGRFQRGRPGHTAGIVVLDNHGRRLFMKIS